MDALKAAEQKVTKVATGGDKETKVVEKVDHHAPAAAETEATTTEPVEIVHKSEESEAPKDGTAATGKSMLAGAKEAVSKTVDSAKAAFSSNKKTDDVVEPKKTEK